MPDPKHLVRTHSLHDSDYAVIRHPLNPRSEIRVARLGDRAGMQRAFLSIARLPPGKDSFAPHAHALQEEFLFILEGRGLALIGEEQVEVGPGDYLGFPTDGTTHHLTNIGEGELVYLMGGERTAVEVARFPSVGKVAVFTSGAATFYEEGAGQTLPLSAWRAQDGTSAALPQRGRDSKE
jgi:uncharacterized cupin superfamily protein